MDHLELLKSLGKELVLVKKYFKHIKYRGNCEYSGQLGKWATSCDKLSDYCKNVEEHQRVLSEFCHEELLELLRVINEVKISSNDFKVGKLDSHEEIEKHSTKIGTTFDNFAVIEGLKEEIPEAVKEKLKRYVDKGRYLKDCSLTLKLKEELANLKIPGSPSYYCALIGPHLLGKTQTSFTLSHLMDVFHININFGRFFNFGRKKEDKKNIDLVTKSLSKLFLNAIGDDMNDTRRNYYEGGARAFLQHEEFVGKRFRFLGLTFMLLKWKRVKSAEFSDQEKWYSSFAAFESVVVKPLSQAEFKLKMQENGFAIQNTLIFIDGMTKLLTDHISTVKFLANLCRAVELPVILSGTDPEITTFTDESGTSNARKKSNESSSQNNPNPSAKIVSRTPNDPDCFLKCLGCSIDVKLESETVKLETFIQNGKINFDRLVYDLIGENQNSPHVKVVLEFLFEQLSTNFPGLVTACIEFALEILSIYRKQPFDLMNFWTYIVRYSSIKLCRKNGKILWEGSFGLTAHILTFPPGPNKITNSDLEKCIEMVDGHYYLYGNSSESIFNIYYVKDSDPNYPVYFPDLEEEFLFTISCLHTWFLNLDSYNRMKGTLGYYYRKFIYGTRNFFLFSPREVNQYCKILANWSICFGSHSNSNGKAKPLEIIEHFVRNIQSISRPYEKSGIDFKSLVVPESLRNFLDTIEIPCLFLKGTRDLEIVKRVSKFMQMGQFHLARDPIEWDVTFDVKRIGETDFTNGCIECNLWATSVGIHEFSKVYETACEDALPISIAVVGSFQESLQNFDVSEEANIVEEEVKVGSKRHRKKLESLCNKQKNKINIYTIEFNESDFSFKSAALKEFDDPVGVFLLVNSNFKL